MSPLKNAPRRPRVLALGSGITLLGTVRSLSHAGADVLALPGSDHVTRRSRSFRAAPRELAPVNPGDLAEFVGIMPADTVLVPCSDDWVKAVAALPAALRARYPASLPRRETLELLLDKARFRTTLERLALVHPMTHLIESLQDLQAVPASAFASSFLKPVNSQKFFARFGVKAFRVDGKHDALLRLAECLDAGLEMMLQEYIPGPPTNHYFLDGFVDREGVVRAMLARRRLRMSPPDFGNSTLMVTVPLGETGDAGNSLRSLFADIGYRGIFSAEFKRDERDGAFNLIEVNARPWWYVEFATRCGVNVCALAVRDALGDPVETISKYTVGRRCVFPYYDFDAVRAEMSAGRLGLVDWARSWLGAYQPVFRWSDPLPAAAELVTIVGTRIRRIGKRPASAK